jgi:hypothetical protein
MFNFRKAVEVTLRLNLRSQSEYCIASRVISEEPASYRVNSARELTRKSVAAANHKFSTIDLKCHRRDSPVRWSLNLGAAVGHCWLLITGLRRASTRQTATQFVASRMPAFGVAAIWIDWASSAG